MVWKKYRLVFGAAAFIVLVATAVTISKQKNDEQVRGGGENEKITLPKIEIDKLDQLIIQKPGDSAVRFVKQDNAWKITEPLIAEVDQISLDNALKKLTELKAIGVAATKKENHERLGVSNAKGTRIQAKNGELLLMDAYIGEAKGGKTMVRISDQDLVLSTQGSYAYVFTKDLKAWRNKKIVDVDSKKIQQISFKTENGDFSFKRDGDAWEQDSGKKIKDFKSSKVQSVISSLSRLQAKDFATADADASKTGLGESPTASVVLTIVEESEKAIEQDPPEEAKPIKSKTSQVVLSLGNQKGDSDEFYLTVEGKPTVFTIAKYQADKINATKDQFQETEKK